MKIRTDYVTNSSSSSFVICKRNLTENQIKAIEHHGILGEKLGLDSPDWKWSIGQNKTKIWGETTLDNFDMEEFFEKIGVDDSIVLWREMLSEKDTNEDVNTNEKRAERKLTWEELLNEI